VTRLADLHCHILPGIDDGAVDLADAVAMARQATDDGIATVCATPHIRHDHDVRIGELADRVAELQRAVTDAGLEIEIAPGGEVAETALRHLSGEELRAVSLGGANTWILLEPAPGRLGASLLDAVDRLARGGRRAIVAHPERHVGPGFRELLEALIARRTLVQATAAHVLDEHAGPVLAELAADGLIQLIGSDAHSARVGRPVAISAALERLPPSLREFAAQAPAAILRGRLVEPPQADASGRST
jgi:protein-tyrosine phosphatase